MPATPDPGGPLPPPDPGALRCVTWNVHRGVGAGGRFDPERILAVIGSEVAAEAPDLLVLQEADADAPPHEGVIAADRIEAATGLRHAQGPAWLRSGPASLGFLGVAAFVHPRVAVTDARLVDLPGRVDRGAVVLDLAAPLAEPLRVVATHLSLAQWLRAVQLRTIGQHLRRSGPMDAAIVGDLNEWRPWGGLALSRRILGFDMRGPAPATFPARWPVLPLDRVLGSRPGMVHGARVLDGAGARSASDHRPLAATVRLRPAG